MCELMLDYIKPDLTPIDPLKEIVYIHIFLLPLFNNRKDTSKLEPHTSSQPNIPSHIKPFNCIWNCGIVKGGGDISW